MNKNVLRGSFDQSNDIVLVVPKKCPLTEVLPIRQNEIVQGCSKKITRLKIAAKYGLEPLKWDHNTFMDA